MSEHVPAAVTPNSAAVELLLPGHVSCARTHMMATRKETAKSLLRQVHDAGSTSAAHAN